MRWNNATLPHLPTHSTRRQTHFQRQRWSPTTAPQSRHIGRSQLYPKLRMEYRVEAVPYPCQGTASPNLRYVSK